nr:hypothetical protein [Nitrosomonas nitrosa]
MDALVLDQAIETALIKRDFVGLRKALMDWGYPIPQDESESNMFEALFKSLELQESRHIALETAGRTLQIEEMIRNKDTNSLRLLLLLLGHKIEKAEFAMLLGQEDGLPSYADEFPGCSPN